jgi:hypothetical protein
VVRVAVEMMDVGPDNLPCVLPVQAQRLASVGVDLNCRDMGEICLFQPQGLPAGSGTDFQAGQLRHGIPQCTPAKRGACTTSASECLLQAFS